MLTTNARRQAQGWNPDRVDPTRTTMLRRAWLADLRRRFAKIRREIMKLVRHEDAFGLTANLASTQIDLPQLRLRVEAMQRRIDPADVLKFPSEPHVTIFYGLTGETPDEAQKVLAGAGVVRLSFGDLDLFENDDADVLIVRVKSKGLELLHERLATLPNEQTHADYQPHLTVAYLKPGSGRKYLDSIPNLLSDATAGADKIEFSNSERDKTTVTLNCGGKGGTPGPCKSLHDVKAAHAELSHTEIAEQVQQHFAGKSKAESIKSLKEFGIVTPPRSKAHAVEMATQRISELKESVGRTAEIGAKPLKTSDTRLPFDIKDRKVGERPEFDKLIGNAARWQFLASPDQLKQFQEWLKRLLTSELIGRNENELWAKYVQQGFAKGAGRSFDDVKQSQLRKERPDLFLPGAQESLRDFYNGTKQEFLQSAFGRPVAVEKVKLLAARTFEDLKTVVTGMESKIRRELVDGLIAGEGPISIAREMAGYVDGGLANAERIARTEITRAHAQGQLIALREMGVQKLGVMVEWSTAGDSAVCELCRPMEGAVLQLDEAEALLPRHPNCLPSDCLVLSTTGITATSERLYDGDMIVTRTSSGRILTCTPNHPILTLGGWVPAKLLELDNYVICDGRRQWEPSADHDDENMPTPIHKVSETLRRSRHVTTAEVPTATPDFHGDGMDGEITVIRTYGELRNALDTARGKHLHKLPFIVRRATQSILSCGCSAAQFAKRCFASSAGFITSLDLLTPLFDVHARPFKNLGFALVANGYAGFGQSSANDTPINLEHLGQEVLGLTRLIKGGNLLDRQCLPFLRRVLTAENAHDDFNRDAELARQICGGATGPVFADKVVSLVVKKFRGHVYNLQTGNGSFSANGIITHNCRCAFLPANVGEDDEGQVMSKSGIEAALKKSVKLEGGSGASSWLGADRIGTISKNRPGSIIGGGRR